VLNELVNFTGGALGFEVLTVAPPPPPPQAAIKRK